MRFKCKRCGKLVIVINEDDSEILCQNCGTTHLWLYEDGWGYYAKDFTKKKCPICKGYVLINRDLLSIDNCFFRIRCNCCEQELLVKRKYNKLSLFPFNTLVFPCKWCGEQIECNVDYVSNEYINRQTESHAKHIEICRCVKCNNRTKVEFIPCWDDRFYTVRILKPGRKKRINYNVIDEFIKNVGEAYKEKVGYAADFYVVGVGDGPMKL